MGKIVFMLVFCIASAAAAVHEARPPKPLPKQSRLPAERLPDRVNVVETTDPARFAKPLYIRPLVDPLPPQPVQLEPPPMPPPPPQPSAVLERYVVDGLSDGRSIPLIIEPVEMGEQRDDGPDVDRPMPDQLTF